MSEQPRSNAGGPQDATAGQTRRPAATLFDNPVDNAPPGAPASSEARSLTLVLPDDDAGDAARGHAPATTSAAAVKLLNSSESDRAALPSGADAIAPSESAVPAVRLIAAPDADEPARAAADPRRETTASMLSGAFRSATSAAASEPAAATGAVRSAADLKRSGPPSRFLRPGESPRPRANHPMASTALPAAQSLSASVGTVSPDGAAATVDPCEMSAGTARVPAAITRGETSTPRDTPLLDQTPPANARAASLATTPAVELPASIAGDGPADAAPSTANAPLASTLTLLTTTPSELRTADRTPPATAAARTTDPPTARDAAAALSTAPARATPAIREIGTPPVETPPPAETIRLRLLDRGEPTDAGAEITGTATRTTTIAAAANAGPTLSAAPAKPKTDRPAPERVGTGRLQPTRVNWRPGEPLGGTSVSPAQQRGFRWDVMLSTACGVAACGMVGVWLLRALLS